ncbi:LEA type 2 family protein [Caldithrix abyssi]
MKKIVPGVLLLGLFMLNGCQQLWPLLQKMNIQKPVVKLKTVQLHGLSLKGIDLEAKLSIKNPNPVGIKLAGYDYELLIEEHSFLNGRQEQTLKIAAHGQSEIGIPFSFSFKQLYKSFQTLKTADSITYTLRSGLTFDVPVLGKIRLPVQTTQRLPNVKIPEFKVAALKLKHLGFNGADLSLSLEVDNPNAWSLDLQNLNYQFVVNGQKWIEGILQQKLQIGQKQKQRIEIPVHLNFLEMGRSLYQLLKNPAPLEYQLTGRARLNSSIKLLGSFELPLDQKGRIKLLK